jgi:hypothetical protein
VTEKKLKKTTIHSDKLISEINWYLTIPDALKKYTPKIYDYSLADNPYLEMEYYKLKSLSDFFMEEDKKADEWKAIVDKIIKVLDDFSKFKISLTEDTVIEYVRGMYLLKTLDRLNDLKKNHKWNFFFVDDIFINGTRYNKANIFNDLNLKLTELFKSYKKSSFNIIHGDFHLGNMLYDTDKEKLILIDPRGKFSVQSIYGDPYYDIAKLAHCVSGGYDLILNDKYSLSFDKNKISFELNWTEYKKEIRKLFFDRIFSAYDIEKINLIQSLLFLSMIPLHAEDFNRQLAFLSRGIFFLYNTKEGVPK